MGEVNGKVVIGRGWEPGKVYAKKPGNRSHEINSKSGGKNGGLKPLFNIIAYRKIREVINIDAHKDGRKGARNHFTIEEAWLFCGR